MTSLDIKTADELILLDLDNRWKTRRAARETDLVRWILRAFVDRGGPIVVADVVAAAREASPEVTRQALAALDDDDLIGIREGHVHIAYPFSAFPTSFLTRLPDGAERYACCAIDALGIAPMIGQRVEIQSRCHHCAIPVEFSVTPDGPEPAAQGVMLSVGTRLEERCKVADSL